MSYLTRHFMYTTEHDSGMHGWIPSDCENNETFTPGAARLVAHDVLEHFMCDGSIEDEMLALGAVHYVRGDLGRVTHPEVNDLPASNFALDMSSAWFDSMYCDIRAIRSPASYQHQLWESWYVDELRSEFMRNVASEVSDRRETDPDWSTAYALRQFTYALNWVRRGYLKAQRRYTQRVPSLKTCMEQHEVADLFWRIAEDVEDKTKYLDDVGGSIHGRKMAIHVNIRRRSFNVRIEGWRDEL